MLVLAFAAPASFTFAFFGCNRIDAKDLDAVNNPSSANRAQLKQTLTEVAASHVPLLFAGGDIVNGYVDDDGTVLKTQLAAWSKEVSWLPKSTTLVAVPGNHELNKKVVDQRMPSTLTYPIWTDWVKGSGYLFGKNGPTPQTDLPDELVLDESKLSYTLDRAGVRFIVLNTDTRTKVKDPVTETALGWIPAKWAGDQLAKAEKDPKIHAVFMIAHRNLIDPSEGKGDAPVDKRASDQLVAAMQGKSKFKAYVCAHVHAWNVRTIPGTTAVQIISGDGGSKLEKGAKEEFGWVEIRVGADGKTSYVHHHRAMPTPYDSTHLTVPTVSDSPVNLS